MPEKSNRTAESGDSEKMSYRYNPYRDMFEHLPDESPISANGTGTASPADAIPVYTYPITYLDRANCWIVDAEQRTDVIAWMPLPEPWKGEADAEIH